MERKDKDTVQTFKKEVQLRVIKKGLESKRFLYIIKDLQYYV